MFERYPVVERAAADVQMLSDPSFAENIRSLIEGILRDGKGHRPRPQKGLTHIVLPTRTSH